MMEIYFNPNVDVFTEEIKQGVTNILKGDVATVTFTKQDGTLRAMKCTLKGELLPQVTVKEETKEVKPRKVNPDVLSVWDVDSIGWRSFRWDSLQKIEFTGN